MAEIKTKEELTGKVYASGKIIASLVSEKGAKGDAGAKGDSGTISIGEVKSGEIAEVTNSGTSTDAIFNFVLPKGEKGEPGEPGEKGADGTGVNILGTYESEEILKENHPTGNIGDAYMIGGSLYVWSVNDNTWINVGSIKGEKGDKGDKGEPGEKGADGQKGADGEPGEKGEKGDKGDTGDKGEPGEQGIQGEKGDESYPIGTIVEYDGDTIPSGFELVEDNSASVIVSSTEPTTGEEVWIQKGKNLFDGKLEYGTISTSNGILGDATTAIRSVNYIKINQESGYTISNNKNYENIVFYYDKDFNCLGHDRASGGVLSFKPKANTAYIKFRTSTTSTQNDLTTLFQLEQGYVATEIESYIPKKIHTKNGNIYEEFYNEENREVYSKGEQKIGTWVDGKPLYKKTISMNYFEAGEKGYAHGISNVDKIIEYSGIGIRKDNTHQHIPAIVPPTYQADWQISVYDVSSTEYKLFIGEKLVSSSSAYLTELYITFKYTKTTD